MSFMNNKCILFTGSEGFIERYAVQSLYLSGYHVVGLDRRPFSENPHCMYLQGDLVEFGLDI